MTILVLATLLVASRDSRECLRILEPPYPINPKFSKGTESSTKTHIRCHVRKRRHETRRVASESEAGACSVDCSHARSESLEGSRLASVPLQRCTDSPVDVGSEHGGCFEVDAVDIGLVSSHLLLDLLTENAIVLEGEDEG